MKDIKNKFRVVQVDNKTTHEWILNKHYAKRLPIINYSFALVDNDLNEIVGICTYGTPACRFNLSQHPLELNRLCVNDGLPKNTLSYFVGNTLKLLPINKFIVSYADSNMNHCGYIYQATNWMYTGTSSKEKIIIINGKVCHRKAVFNMYGTSSISKLIELGLSVEVKQQEGKYRYFYITGNNKDMKKELVNKYKIKKYPKFKNKKYDSSYMCKNTKIHQNTI